MLCEIELFYCLAFIMVLYPVVALGWSKVARGTRPGTEDSLHTYTTFSPNSNNDPKKPNGRCMEKVLLLSTALRDVSGYSLIK